MFEAIVTLCAGLETGPCRDTLLPGYEGGTQAACQEALATHPPDIAGFRPLEPRGAPLCRSTGQALLVEQVADGVFVHRGLIEEAGPGNLGDISNIAFVVGNDAVAVIDSGSARWMGEALWRAIRARTDRPVTHVILTHMHPDHVFGTGPLAETGAEIVGHEGIGRALADRQGNYLQSLDRLVGPEAMLGTAPPRIDREIAQETTLDLGGRRLVLHPWPTAHTGTDLTVYDEATGTMIAGDLVFDGHVPALDGSLRGWQAVLSEMAERDFARLIPGHGGPVLDWPEGATPMERYLETLAEDTRAALDAGERLGEAVTHVAGDEAPRWQLFDAFNARNATVAYTELEWE